VRILQERAREMVKKKRCNYTYVIDGRVLLIEDQYESGDDMTLTLTNGMAEVIQELSKELNTNMHNFDVIYRDTDRVIDGVFTDKDGKFTGFYSIGCEDMWSAKLKIKHDGKPVSKTHRAPDGAVKLNDEYYMYVSNRKRGDEWVKLWDLTEEQCLPWVEVTDQGERFATRYVYSTSYMKRLQSGYLFMCGNALAAIKQVAHNADNGRNKMSELYVLVFRFEKIHSKTKEHEG
jgi:hypothetical protein